MIIRSKLVAAILVVIFGTTSPTFSPMRAGFNASHSHAGVFWDIASDVNPSATGGGSAGYNWAVEHDG